SARSRRRDPSRSARSRVAVARATAPDPSWNGGRTPRPSPGSSLGPLMPLDHARRRRRYGGSGLVLKRPAPPPGKLRRLAPFPAPSSRFPVPSATGAATQQEPGKRSERLDCRRLVERNRNRFHAASDDVRVLDDRIGRAPTSPPLQAASSKSSSKEVV